VLALAALLFLPATDHDRPEGPGRQAGPAFKAVRDGSLLWLTISIYGPWASKRLQNSATGPEPRLDSRGFLLLSPGLDSERVFV
jgi:hypothetical protein